jgi:hypothetical protein
MSGVVFHGAISGSVYGGRAVVVLVRSPIVISSQKKGFHMFAALFHALLMQSNHLTLAILASPPPLDPTNLLTDIFNWLVKILSAVAMVFFVIDLFKHVASSPRDLGAAGKDALILVVLLAIAAKADVLVKWAISAL